MTFESIQLLFAAITAAYAAIIYFKDKLPEQAFITLNALYARVTFWIFIYCVFVLSTLKFFYLIAK